MCHFITTILPDDANREKLKSLYREHGFDFRIVDDFHLADYLEKGDFCAQTSRGMCDCGTIIGSFAPDSDELSVADATLNKSIARFRKKGWSEAEIQSWIDKSNEEAFLRAVKRKFKNKRISEAKIQRWNEQSAENRQKYQTTRAEREEKIREAEPQTAQWLGFLAAVLDSGLTSRIGLLLHDYGGNNNKIKLQSRETVKLKNLTPRCLLEVREDVIYEFVL